MKYVGKTNAYQYSLHFTLCDDIHLANLNGGNIELQGIELHRRDSSKRKFSPIAMYTKSQTSTQL